MCKHVAATLYAVGIRLDSEPAEFFTLRGIDIGSFVDQLLQDRVGRMLENADVKSSRIIEGADITAIFGISAGLPDMPDMEGVKDGASPDRPVDEKPSTRIPTEANTEGCTEGQTEGAGPHGPEKKPVGHSATGKRTRGSASLVSRHFFEIDGKQIDTEKVAADVREAYRALSEPHGDIMDLKIYYNFKEGRAYYVVNGEADGAFVAL